jgi:nitrogen fixation protein FixH
MNYKFLITTISSLVLAIIAGSLYAGIVMREVTVVEHPYQDGLQYDSMRKRSAALGWKLAVPPSLAENEVLKVVVSDRNDVPMDVDAVEFAVSKVASTDVKTYRTQHSGRGGYTARINCPSAGYWDVKVKVTLGGDTMNYDSRIRIGKQ